MVSLWSSRGRNTNDSGEEQQRNVSDHQQREPDERSRLLPQSAPHEGYLSPDDPAVSPYNLWSVRALRFFTCVLLTISFVWWVFLLVSIFFSPRFTHNRGSGFTDFSYTTLTVGNLIVSLLFFAIPSQPMIIWNSVLAVFLSVDMIIILVVPRIRLEEGWVGIASIVWAVLISMYNVVQVYCVEKGKEEEEERLTGRVETRRSLFEWISVLVETIVLGVITVVAILLTATLILRSRDASLETPGSRYLVNNGNYEVHLACVGNITTSGSKHGKKQVNILLEAGETPSERSLEPFMHNVYRNGTIDRYCYWDRPGFGWSDNAPSPHSAGMAADAISEALALAGEEGPWILVSAGVGSLYSRIFASRHIRDVQGLFMIDPTHEDQLHKIGNPGRGFVLWGRGVISPLGLDRLAGAIFKGRSREDRVYGKVSYQNGKFIKAKLQENLVATSMTASEIASAKNIQTPDTPLVVVSSGVEVRRDEKWAKEQEEMTKITKNLVSWDVVKGAGHEVWQSWEGRQVLEKRLGELVKQA